MSNNTTDKSIVRRFMSAWSDLARAMDYNPAQQHSERIRKLERQVARLIELRSAPAEGNQRKTGTIS